ncbi:LysR family transcriptional regulator [Pandoraea eparura]|uniref:LysR family transcriptional regulator n=1 Tax=Pandoraea eparura TaxID=2508291 RepID=A0A5E4U377_9BURK|nr:LysR family transcriptional regulator [Pandoraea eparura]
MRKIPPLATLQAFEAASRLGSFIRAAEELHLTPSAVSHRIRELERLLGIQLFHRIHRSVILTDAGRKFARNVGDAFGQIESGVQEISRAGKSDLINVHVVPSLGAQWLMPRIARFTTMYPDVDVRITASGEKVDLEDGMVDFDIRYGAGLARAGIETEMFPPEPIVALCSPNLVEGNPCLRTPTDLSHQMLIHSEVNLYTWRNWEADHPGVQLNLERGPRFDRSFMSIFAAIDSLGVCLESMLLVERQLASGVLVLPFGKEGPRIECHSLNYLSSRGHLPKMRLFREWLMQALAESPSLNND